MFRCIVFDQRYMIYCFFFQKEFSELWIIFMLNKSIRSKEFLEWRYHNFDLKHS